LKLTSPIAIDVDGHLFAVSFDTLYRCSAYSAACKTLASLPGQFNGFTLVPKGTIEATKEITPGRHVFAVEFVVSGPSTDPKQPGFGGTEQLYLVVEAVG
jgi:hypothetical protein